ncbi:RICIN domain-containing protein [Streptomyces sp. NPDC049585]|uniref:RICIN domain-containing protein n=1 Tax=Streptomyces sp. NPDC049585 TaxID=3155154 RepID=UPI0034362A46
MAVIAAAGSLMVLTPGTSQATDYIELRNQNSGKCLEVENSSHENGARVQQWDCRGQEGSQWFFYKSPVSGYLQIRNRFSDMCLEVADGDTRNGARIQVWGCVAGARNQAWIVGGGKIINYGTNKAVEIADSSTDNGAPAQQWNYVGYATQRWNTSSIG